MRNPECTEQFFYACDPRELLDQRAPPYGIENFERSIVDWNFGTHSYSLGRGQSRKIRFSKFLGSGLKKIEWTLSFAFFSWGKSTKCSQKHGLVPKIFDRALLCTPGGPVSWNTEIVIFDRDWNFHATIDNFKPGLKFPIGIDFFWSHGLWVLKLLRDSELLRRSVFTTPLHTFYTVHPLSEGKCLQNPGKLCQSGGALHSQSLCDNKFTTRSKFMGVT